MSLWKLGLGYSLNVVNVLVNIKRNIFVYLIDTIFVLETMSIEQILFFGIFTFIILVIGYCAIG